MMEKDVRTVFAERLATLRERYREDGVDDGVIHGRVRRGMTAKTRRKRVTRWLLVVAVVVAVLGWIGYDILEELVMETVYGRCLVENNIIVTEASRPLMDCAVCADLTAVPVREDLTAEEFAARYAYDGIPVLVKNGTRDWDAIDTFTFDYFKKTYEGSEDALTVTDEECQFFPYDTDDVNSLAEAFNMSAERVTLQPGQKPWYIGWSNCHPGVAEELRRHYRRPFFLPPDSESSQIDWIFMGGAGPGADIHLDYVERPSWQAQISGTKTWTLVPVPECESVCHSMKVTVHTGDIIVLDTNQWYHSTHVHPGALSITIGSEYD